MGLVTPSQRCVACLPVQRTVRTERFASPRHAMPCHTEPQHANDADARDGWSPRQESNLYLALRRRSFYPVNYGGNGGF